MASRGPRKPESKEVRFSKAMTYILRHGAEKEGIQMTKDGFVKLSDILQNKSFKDATKEDLLKIVEECPKKRFYVENRKDENGQEETYIRANQGHTLENVEVEMTEINEDNLVSECIHGTYFAAWNSIKTQGLSKMNRQHIHLAIGLPSAGNVISGMRSSCQVAIYIDLPKAIKDGIKFYRSANDVILCPGNSDGFLRPKYFLKVIDIKRGTEMTDYSKAD